MPHCTALSVPFKTCTKCGLYLPATPEFFNRGKLGLYGLRADCKACAREESRRYRQANREAFNERNRQRWAVHREAERERNRRWYEANAESRREYSRQWCREHREMERARTQRYRARKHNARGDHTAEDVQLIGERQRWRCWWCSENCEDEYHIDHRVPLARGGGNGPENIVIACPACNLSKGARLPHEFNGRLL